MARTPVSLSYDRCERRPKNGGVDRHTALKADWICRYPSQVRMPSTNPTTPSPPAILEERSAGEVSKEHAKGVPDCDPATFGINNWDDLLAYCYAYLLDLQGVSAAEIEAESDPVVEAEILNFMVMWEGRPMTTAETGPLPGQVFTTSIGASTWRFEPTPSRLANVRFHDSRGNQSVCVIIAKAKGPDGEAYGRIIALFRSHPGLDHLLSDSLEQGAAGILQVEGSGKVGLLFRKPPAPTVRLVKELSLGGECLAAAADREQPLADFICM